MADPDLPPDARVEIKLLMELGGLSNSIEVVDDPYGSFDDFIPRIAIVFGDTPKGPGGMHFLAGGVQLMSVEEINSRITMWGQVITQKINNGDYNRINEPSDDERRGGGNGS